MSLPPIPETSRAFAAEMLRRQALGRSTEYAITGAVIHPHPVMPYAEFEITCGDGDVFMLRCDELREHLLDALAALRPH
jgi:hypothetical protein